MVSAKVTVWTMWQLILWCGVVGNVEGSLGFWPLLASMADSWDSAHTEQLTGVLLVCERGRFAGINDPEKRSGRRCRLSCTAVGQGLDIFPKCAEAVSVPGRHLVPLNWRKDCSLTQSLVDASIKLQYIIFQGPARKRVRGNFKSPFSCVVRNFFGGWGNGMTF